MPNIEDVLAQYRSEKGQDANPQPKEDSRGFLERAFDDLKGIGSRYIDSAVTGYKNIINKGDELAEQNPLALSGTPMKDLGNYRAPEQTGEQTAALGEYQGAVNKFYRDTVQPPAAAAAMVGAVVPNPISGVAGLVALPGVVEGAGESYQNGGLTQALRDLTYGPAVDFWTQPDLAQKIHDTPVSAFLEGGMATGQLLFGAKGIYDGGRYAARQITEKVGPSVEENLSAFRESKQRVYDDVKQQAADYGRSESEAAEFAQSYTDKVAQGAARESSMPDDYYSKDLLLQARNAAELGDIHTAYQLADRAGRFEIERFDTKDTGELSNENIERPSAQNPLVESPEEINNKDWYHGTGAVGLTADTLTPNSTKIDGLFGHGIYLTDNSNIAQGYANARGRRTKTPVVYQAKVNVGKVINLEKTMPEDAYQVFKQAAESIARRYDYPEIVSSIEKAKSEPGEKVYRDFSNGIEELSQDLHVPFSDIVEDFQDLSANLKLAGYDAYTHVGGKRTGKDPHQVLIMLDPNDELSQSGRGNQITGFSPYKKEEFKKTPSTIAAGGPTPQVGAKVEGKETKIESVLNKSSFIQDDVAPAIKTALNIISEGVQDIRNTLAPGSSGENAKVVSGIMRENLAEMAQKADRANNSLKVARDYFSKQAPEANLQFMNAIEAGAKQSIPELQEFADTMRQILDGRRQEIQDLGTGKLQKYIENYFPHMWKDPKVAENFAAAWFGKRPFEGKKSFLKSRSLPTIADGIEAGLEPISYNPVDLTIMKMREMDKYIMAHRTLNELKEKGLVKFIGSTSSDRPEGWIQIDDRVGTVYGPSDINVKEAYDPAIMGALNNTLQKLGVDHTRQTKVSLEHNTKGVWGYTDNRSDTVTTKFGGPESVVAHELGHQLAYKYDLDNLFRNDDTPVKIRNGRYTTAGEEMARELKILADKRLAPNEMSEDRRAYVQGKTEPIAAVVESYVHAPEILKEYAPTVYKKFVEFLNDHPELHELRDIKPSLLLDENTSSQSIGGLVVQGNYYLPEDAGRLINNYLAPGLRNKSGLFRTYLGAANVMNQFQLGMSAFHLGFTSMDSIVSKVALAAYKMSRGDVTGAAKDLIHAPVAPIENAMRGDKLYQEWMKPGSTDLQTAELVDALKAGGGRIKMDDMYQTKILQNIKDAWNRGNYTGTFGRIPFAIMEQSVKPILEYIVPRQKLGVFADLMRYEMERDPNMTREDLRHTAGLIWNSVDNRLGQLVYDNLFWHKTLKDVTMASVRSVGWNLGTFRELGGAVVDTGKQISRTLEGDKPEMTYRMSYGIALPITVGIFGAIIQYLYTGQGPQEVKDLFFPRTGTLDKNGRPQRIELPSYMKDVYAYYEHPGTTLTNKLHPMISTMADLFNNKDYYSRKIYNEDDPKTKEAADILQYLAKAFVPFSLQGSKYQADLGGDVLNKTLPFIGITPAPADVNKTDVEKQMSELIRARMPLGAKTQEESDKADLKTAILRELQMNNGKPTQSLIDAVSTGKISKEEANRLKNESKESPLERNAKKLDADDIKALIPQANPEERTLLEKVLTEKLKRAKKKVN